MTILIVHLHKARVYLESDPRILFFRAGKYTAACSTAAQVKRCRPGAFRTPRQPRARVCYIDGGGNSREH